MIEYSSGFLLVVTKVIQAEWPIVIIHIADRFTDILIGFDREQWPENFLLHAQHVVGGVEHKGRRNTVMLLLAEILIGRINGNNLGTLRLGIGQVILKPVVVTFIND